MMGLGVKERRERTAEQGRRKIQNVDLGEFPKATLVGHVLHIDAYSRKGWVRRDDEQKQVEKGRGKVEFAPVPPPRSIQIPLLNLGVSVAMYSRP